MVVAFAFTSLFGALAPSTLVAADCATGDPNNPIKTSIISGPACDGNSKSGKVEDNPIWKLLIFVLNIMIAGVGVLAVAGVVYASVLYVTAADRADQIKKAKDLILNVAIGVIAFGLMYSFLNFLIPGGIFN